MQIDEPWKIDEYYVVDKEGCYIGLVGEMGGEECARRIVACVNACAGIEDERLGSLASMARLGIELTDAINDPDGRFHRLEKEHYANEFALEKAGISGESCETKVSKGIEILTAQRDGLLAALNRISNFTQLTGDDAGEMRDIARESIGVPLA